MEGPFYIASPTRADITSGRSGAPLSLALRVVDPVCRPLKGATVALWHSDATGVYSAFASRPDGGNIVDKLGENFLRGEQKADSDGRVAFRTIVPGWYSGRPVHVHVKVRFGEVEFTTQLYFGDEVLREVAERAEYKSRGRANTGNTDERVPEALVLELEKSGDGYAAEYEISVEGSEGVENGGSGGSGDPESDGTSACFPGDALVELEDGRQIRMAELKIGDRVSVGRRGVHSDVFAFTHRLSDAQSEYVVLDLGSGRALTASPGHYIYANDALVAAGSVRVGDELRCAGEGEAGVVVGVRRAVRRGLYNPQTLDGDIVVDGVVASTYTTALSAGVAHAALAGPRMWYRIFGGDALGGALDGGSALLAQAVEALGCSGRGRDTFQPLTTT